MRRQNNHGYMNVIVSYLGILAGILNTILKAKVFTPEEIGLIATIFTFATIAAYVINFGTSAGKVRFYSKFNNETSEKTGFLTVNFVFNVFMFLLSSLLFFIAKNFILNKYANPLLNQYIQFSYVFFFGNMINQYFKDVFIAEKRSLNSTFVGDVLIRFLRLIIFVIFLTFNIQLTFYFYFEALILLIVIFIFLINTHKIQLSFPHFHFLKKDFLLSYLNFSGHMFFSNIISVLIVSIDKIMIGIYTDLENLGIYTISSIFIVFINAIGKSFIKSASPFISEFWEENNTKAISELYKENLNITLFISLFIYSCIIIFGKPLLLFVNEEYLKGYWVVLILGLAQIINISSGLSGTIISYSPQFKLDLYSKIPLIIVSILCNRIFIPLWGLEGAAFATLLSISGYNIFKLVYVKIHFKLWPYSKETVKILILFLLNFALMFFIQRYVLTKSILILFFMAVAYSIFYIVIAYFVFKLSFVKDIYSSIRSRRNE